MICVLQSCNQLAYHTHTSLLLSNFQQIHVQKSRQWNSNMYMYNMYNVPCQYTKLICLFMHSYMYIAHCSRKLVECLLFVCGEYIIHVHVGVLWGEVEAHDLWPPLPWEVM